jgi:hypothetical protein
MGVKMRFRCDHCQAPPDAATCRALQAQLHDRRLGVYLDAQPGGWLVFTGGGPLGAKRYACPEHRDDLTVYLHRHYGAIGPTRVHATEAIETLWPDGFTGFDEREFRKLLGGSPV